MQLLKKISEIWAFMQLYTFIKFIPKVLNWVEIGWLWGPLDCMNFFVDIHVFTIMHICLESLFCWNIQFAFKFSHAYDYKWHCKMSLYIAQFIWLWICTEGSTPFSENAPCTIMYPLPCFIVETWYLQSYLLPWDCCTHCFPSIPKRLNFDSSKKK